MRVRPQGNHGTEITLGSYDMTVSPWYFGGGCDLTVSYEGGAVIVLPLHADAVNALRHALELASEADQ